MLSDTKRTPTKKSRKSLRTKASITPENKTSDVLEEKAIALPNKVPTLYNDSMAVIHEEKEQDNAEKRERGAANEKETKRSSITLTQDDNQLVGNPFAGPSTREAPRRSIVRDNARGSVRFAPGALNFDKKPADKIRSRSPDTLKVEDVLTYNYSPEPPKKKVIPYHDRLRSRQELLGILLRHAPEKLGIDVSQISSKQPNDNALSKKSKRSRGFSVSAQSVKLFGKTRHGAFTAKDKPREKRKYTGFPP